MDNDQSVVTVLGPDRTETKVTRIDLTKKAARSRAKDAKTQDKMTAIAVGEVALPQPALKQIFNEQILKVKVMGGEQNFREVSIIYQMVNDRHDPILCDLTLGEKPHPDLFTALNALLTLSVDYGGLDKDVWREGWVSGVSIKPNVGLNVTAQCPIAGLDSPALSNTPYLQCDLLTTKEKALIDSVIQQARLFIYGKRAQTELDLKL